MVPSAFPTCQCEIATASYRLVLSLVGLAPIAVYAQLPRMDAQMAYLTTGAGEARELMRQVTD